MEGAKFKKRPKSVSSDNRLRPKSSNTASPYSQNYRAPIPHCQKHLISMHLAVTKLSRPELEDRYLQLCDENYQIKHENKDLKERLKVLTTRIMRVSSAGLIKKFKSVDGLSHSSKENDNEVCTIGHKPHRPASQRTLKSRNESRDNVEFIANILQGSLLGTSATNLSKTKKQQSLDQHRIEELHEEINKNKEEIDELKAKNSDWEEKFKELDGKLFDETKKLVAATMAVKSLKRKSEKYEVQVKQLKTEKRELENKLDRTMESERKRCDELKSSLEQERKKVEDLTEQKRSLEVDRQQILDLKEQIIQLETEKSSLRVQQENFNRLVDDASSSKAQLDDLKDKYDKTCKEMEQAKSQVQALETSQDHLLSKVLTLQDENDNLTVEVQGLKGRLDYFTNENVSLELRLRDVEAQKTDLETEVRRSSLKNTKIENMKELLINKLSAVTFEPWEVDGVRSPPSAASSRRSSETSQKSLSKILGTPSNQSPQKINNLTSSSPTNKSSDIVNESELIKRNLSPAHKSPVHGKLQRFKTFSISLDDSNSILTMDNDDMTPTKDVSVEVTKNSEVCAHDISLQAETAAKALIKSIKRSSIPNSEDLESSLGTV